MSVSNVKLSDFNEIMTKLYIDFDNIFQGNEIHSSWLIVKRRSPERLVSRIARMH